MRYFRPAQENCSTRCISLKAGSSSAHTAAPLQARLDGDPAAVAVGRADQTGAQALGASQEAPRRPLIGMILHQDASRFVWLPGDDRQYDLVVTLDDATSAIYSAFLVEEKGTLSSFRGIGEVIDKYGLFCELYTDRGSHYFHTPKAGEPVSRGVRTRAGRAWPARYSRYRGLFARGARPFRARLRNRSGPLAQGACLGQHRHDRGGQVQERGTDKRSLPIVARTRGSLSFHIHRL
jgi:hypothetical protein